MVLILVVGEIVFRRLVVPAVGITLTNSPDFSQWPGMFIVGLLLPLVTVALSLALFTLVDRRPLSDFGLGMPRPARLVGWGGLGIMLLGFGVLIAVTQASGRAEWGWAQSLSWTSVLTVVAVYVGTGIWEEFFFRGYLYTTLTDYSRATAYVVSILFFTFIHFTEESLQPTRLIALLLTSFLYTYAYDRTGSIWPSVILHGGWDLVNFFVVGNERGISLLTVSGPVATPDRVYSIVLDVVLIALVWVVTRRRVANRAPVTLEAARRA
jgi:membrane protease YdiL (CAAX protease family)